MKSFVQESSFQLLAKLFADFGDSGLRFLVFSQEFGGVGVGFVGFVRVLHVEVSRRILVRRAWKAGRAQ
jgi:hypothetical protein